MKKSSIVLGAFIENNGTALIVKRRDDDETWPGKWEIPGGHMKEGEDIIKGLKREILEETNLAIVPLLPGNVFEYDTTEKGGIHCIEIDFMCRARNPDRIKISEEHTAYAWISKNDLGRYDMTENMKASVLACFNSLNVGLRAETEKWLQRIVVERSKIRLIDKDKEHLLKNADNYISDCGYFLKEGKLIEAFEAVIWGWSILELLKELKIVE